jgi:hypothetical protein
METTTVAAPTKPEIPLRNTYFTEKELAQQLPKCNVRKLRGWRALRKGPKWFRVGREICYLRSSVELWFRENEITISREQWPPRKAERAAKPEPDAESLEQKPSPPRRRTTRRPN